MFVFAGMARVGQSAQLYIFNTHKLAEVDAVVTACEASANVVDAADVERLLLLG